MIAAAHQYQVPVLIDPKGADWNKYRSCDFITPNLKEMCEAAGELVPNGMKRFCVWPKMPGKNMRLKMLWSPEVNGG